ncbi:hypothetical protein M378DRAFT_384419 [Amanita muscaria Koide BX008]|uniref:Uncharacterized protein n=1 Tax=Amanita muscaria (strain Koide BX008) TaxID=946122 RepID=A0A0C2W8E6_AMAMK|nr:hypothetical protein M378DRAFT_384419 [Amanita muscaria Koide BX008]
MSRIRCSSIVSTPMGEIVGVDGVGTEEECILLISSKRWREADDTCHRNPGSGVRCVELSLFFMEIRAIRLRMRRSKGDSPMSMTSGDSLGNTMST